MDRGQDGDRLYRRGRPSPASGGVRLPVAVSSPSTARVEADDLTVGSLFSGIGGLDLGLERAGMRVVWQSENDPYCCKVLHKHWPDVPNLGDVTSIDWSQVEPVDVICGGYPCQPFSLAGTRQGEADARHLWPRFRDAIRHLRPRYALLENVPGHLSLGFGSVLGDLAELGYDCEWDCIPAAAVGAPHLRYRVFVVAYPAGVDGERPISGGDCGGRSEAAIGNGRSGVSHPDGDALRQQPVGVGRRGSSSLVAVNGVNGDVADPAGKRRSGSVIARADVVDHGQESSHGDAGAGRDWWAVEPDVGRVAHGIPNRVDRLRALGNAVVPQVAELIGRRILEAAA